MGTAARDLVQELLAGVAWFSDEEKADIAPLVAPHSAGVR